VSQERLLDLPTGSTVLDLGAASGAIATQLAREGFRVVAVEPEVELIDRAIGSRVATTIAFCRSDGRYLPLGTGSFDGAIMIEVLEHIEDPDLVLLELQRVLRPGGTTLIAVPSSYTEHLYRRLHPRYATNSRHVNIFEETDLVLMLEKAGFAVDRIETRNLGPAIAWIGHSILRSDADHTGRVKQHRWIDLLAASLVRIASMIPLLRGLVAKIGSRFGKSIYVYAHVRDD
jgi:SAM-dependent methyltransferase